MANFLISIKIQKYNSSSQPPLPPSKKTTLLLLTKNLHIPIASSDDVVVHYAATESRHSSSIFVITFPGITTNPINLFSRSTVTFPFASCCPSRERTSQRGYRYSDVCERIKFLSCFCQLAILLTCKNKTGRKGGETNTIGAFKLANKEPVVSRRHTQCFIHKFLKSRC
jgi:hypothetical protein